MCYSFIGLKCALLLMCDSVPLMTSSYSEEVEDTEHYNASIRYDLDAKMN